LLRFSACCVVNKIRKMKRCLFFFFALFLFPSAGRSQLSTVPWTNIIDLGVNLAFGPSTTATWDPSIGFRFQGSDHFRIGIGDLSYGSADLASGTRHAITFGPVAEYLLQRSPTIAYSVIVGIPIQDRWGASIDHTFGVAPYAAGDVDYFFSDQFSVAGILKLQYVATDAYLRMPRMLPSSAFIAALGIGFHYHF
jgi:hypothetical protein